tara:strand:- start:1721 stop:2302 length:582 start_codon:yes stop_codon:yes gene_type:complete
MKVFCIGTWKTGTTSTGNAINVLMGGRHQNWSNPKGRMLYIEDKIDEVINHAKSTRTFDDAPWNCFGVWQKLKTTYTGSKFVLSIRDEEKWFNSMVKWYKGNIKTSRPNANLMPLYERQLTPLGFDINVIYNLTEHKKTWLEWYKKRNQLIIDTFEPSRLLIYDPIDEWEPLCRFLNKPNPNVKFPYLNKNKK